MSPKKQWENNRFLNRIDVIWRSLHRGKSIRSLTSIVCNEISKCIQDPNMKDDTTNIIFKFKRTLL